MRNFMGFLASVAMMLACLGALSGPTLAQQHSHQSGNGQEVSSGIDVRSAWARASAGRAVNGAAYLAIVNSGTRGDRLTGAASSVAMRTEMHDHVERDGVMRMTKLDGLDIPAGRTVVLKPGGLHIMLLRLRNPLKAGDRFDLELHFGSGVTKKVEVEVRPIGGRPTRHEGHGAYR